MLASPLGKRNWRYRFRQSQQLEGGVKLASDDPKSSGRFFRWLGFRGPQFHSGDDGRAVSKAVERHRLSRNNQSAVTVPRRIRR